MEKIQIMYHSDELEKIKYTPDGKGDWIDLRSAENVTLKTGDFKLINLGVSVKIPDGYELIIAPRSSTFKNFGVLQTNGIGVVDNTYCTSKDILMMPVLAMRDTEIHVNDRICQFRIQKNMPELEIMEVENLEGEARGGFGSTGIQ
ncbi:MAG: deoxyuridine 5'-triphosphate nucleotidohydrolase [Lachnospiraceae bacterium]|nr:deoxyuridine 5'-triphosphate nucleotidohydrolase [Lachnospiraceae bacterium]